MALSSDGRKLGRDAQADLRRNAVRQVLAGESPEDVARIAGRHRSWIYRALKAYQTKGEEGIGVHKAPGKPPIMDDRKRQALRKIILGKTPDQLKMEFTLWTVDQVVAYIVQRWEIRLSISTATRILHDLGLSFQKPLTKAFQQDPAAVAKWLEVEYPKIRAKAKRQGAEIFFGDEAGLRSDHHSGRTWGEKGKTPVVVATGARFGFNVVSAVNSHGKFCWMVHEGRFGSDQFIDFMKRLVKGRKRKVFLIVDGHSAHKSKKVLEFVDSRSKQIELFYLPAYSPQLNPDELVWNCLKGDLGRKTVTGPDQMKALATACLDSLKTSPAKIQSLFQERHVRYAA
jgi:transposase